MCPTILDWPCRLSLQEQLENCWIDLNEPYNQRNLDQTTSY